MFLNRRTLVSKSTAASGLLAAVDAHAAHGSRPGRRTFVLQHGSWNSSGVWERVAHLLVGAGHAVVARDLPGCGLNALFPQSYSSRPLNVAAFSAEPSPLAGLKLDDYANSVIGAVRDGVASAGEPVILVGHSTGGIAVTAAAERHPELISDLVYVAGMMNDVGVMPLADITSADNGNAETILSLSYGDSTVTGVLRLDFNSSDATYFAGLQDFFANDTDRAGFRATANLFTPDDAVAPYLLPTAKTAQRWGSVRRSYIRTSLDHALQPALQDRWIAEANALTPGSPTTVYPLATSHSPFISRPDELAAILLDVAAR